MSHSTRRAICLSPKGPKCYFILDPRYQIPRLNHLLREPEKLKLLRPLGTPATCEHVTNLLNIYNSEKQYRCEKITQTEMLILIGLSEFDFTNFYNDTPYWIELFFGDNFEVKMCLRYCDTEIVFLCDVSNISINQECYYIQQYDLTKVLKNLRQNPHKLNEVISSVLENDFGGLAKVLNSSDNSLSSLINMSKTDIVQKINTLLFGTTAASNLERLLYKHRFAGSGSCLKFVDSMTNCTVYLKRYEYDSTKPKVSFYQTVDTLPTTIGYEINWSVDNLLTYDLWNSMLSDINRAYSLKDRLPQSLTHLTFGSKYNYRSILLNDQLYAFENYSTPSPIVAVNYDMLFTKSISKRAVEMFALDNRLFGVQRNLSKLLRCCDKKQLRRYLSTGTLPEPLVSIVKTTKHSLHHLHSLHPCKYAAAAAIATAATAATKWCQQPSRK